MFHVKQLTRGKSGKRAALPEMNEEILLSYTKLFENGA
jgi:hypothetical protein